MTAGLSFARPSPTIHEGARPKAGRGRTAVSAMKCPAKLPAMV